MKSEKSKYPQKTGFKAPENFFESFEERVMQRLNEKELSHIPIKGKIFNVPEGYFDSLEERIVTKTQEEKPVINLFRKEYLYYAAAVAAIFVLMLGNFFQTGNEQPVGWDDIEVSAMENYIDEGYEMGFIEFNSTEFIDIVVEDGRIIDDSDFTTVNSDAVFEYIDENVEDPAYIME